MKKIMLAMLITAGVSFGIARIHADNSCGTAVDHDPFKGEKAACNSTIIQFGNCETGPNHDGYQCCVIARNEG